MFFTCAANNSSAASTTKAAVAAPAPVVSHPVNPVATKQQSKPSIVQKKNAMQLGIVSTPCRPCGGAR